ncbi:hypothetical protein [Kitasatospora sp. NBC_00315]|uniref:hypothetical protein n=1 Tax=Kitasatospora sp. NBC_00315 TaxID=2975963 RepID=UPI00325095BE
MRIGELKPNSINLHQDIGKHIHVRQSGCENSESPFIIYLFRDGSKLCRRGRDCQGGHEHRTPPPRPTRRHHRVLHPWISGSRSLAALVTDQLAPLSEVTDNRYYSGCALRSHGRQFAMVMSTLWLRVHDYRAADREVLVRTHCSVPAEALDKPYRAVCPRWRGAHLISQPSLLVACPCAGERLRPPTDPITRRQKYSSEVQQPGRPAATVSTPRTTHDLHR